MLVFSTGTSLWRDRHIELRKNLQQPQGVLNMFGYLRKAKMMHALDLCQKLIKNLEIGPVLTESQTNTLPHSSLFKGIVKEYKSYGMSHWGGMGWFCGQFVTIGLERVKLGESIEPSVYEIIEKLAFNGTVITLVADNFDLTPADMHAIERAHDTAMEWIEKNPIS